MQTKKIKLLGGSHNGKLLEINDLSSEIHMVKKIRKNYLTYADLIDDSPTMEKSLYEREVYELKKVSFTEVINSTSYLVETRLAYVKKGSKVKTETIWKFGKCSRKEIIHTPPRGKVAST